MQTAQRMTAEEYIALPVGPDDPRVYELVEGELVVHAPIAGHAYIQQEVLVALTDWTRAAPGRGRATFPLDTQLGELNFFIPDLLWYREGRVPARDDPPPYPLPDIAAEVRSASTWRYDIGAKKAAYERHGLPELWLLDTVAQEVLVFRRSVPRARRFDVALELGLGDVLESPLLPGFGLAVAALYRE